MNKLVSSLGIMQGRLLPKYNGKYQAHPVGEWKREFSIAARLGLDYIEFILDFDNVELNPLMSVEGIEEINTIIQQTGVGVRSVCADYFMEAPLHHRDNTICQKSQSILKRLMENGKKIGISDIVIPCVDQSSLMDFESQIRLVKALDPLLVLAEKNGVNLSLETDLAPQPFKKLLDKFESNRVTVNYDTGNSASMGYDPVEEFNAYGMKISDIHIKDRKLHGGSVLLGTGDTNFKSFFTALSTIDYNGPFIMQVYRDEEGIAIFESQLNDFKNFLNYMI